jgi:hypothetical protein
MLTLADIALQPAPVDHTAVYVNAAALVISSALAALAASAGVIFAYVRGRAKGALTLDTETDVREREEFREKVSQIHEQVNNNHDKNLRDELDERFDRLEQRFDAGDRRMDRISKDIGAARTTSRATAREVSQLKDRLENHLDGR